MRFILTLAVIIAFSFSYERKVYDVYRNSGGRVLKIPYGEYPEDVRWHTFKDTVTVTLEVGKKVAYIRKFHSSWKYKTPNDGAWWYTHDGYHESSNAMRWYYDSNIGAVVIEYFHSSNADDDILTRREFLLDVTHERIYR